MRDKFTTNNASATIVEKKQRRKLNWPLNRTLSLGRYGGLALLASLVLNYLFGSGSPVFQVAFVLSIVGIVAGVVGGFAHAHFVWFNKQHPERDVAARLLLRAYLVLGVVALIALSIYGMTSDKASPALADFGTKFMGMVLVGGLIALWSMALPLSAPPDDDDDDDYYY